MRIQIGTRLDGPPGPKYRSSLRFCEFDMRSGLPKPAKLRQWCEPDELGFFDAALVAPDDLLFDERGRPHATNERSVFDRLAGACEALRAHYVVLQTGAKVSPSVRDRERFFAYCDALRATPGCPSIVWRAGGLWEPEEVIGICNERDLWAGLDPFADEISALSRVYLQARAEGGTRRFGEDHFIRLIHKIETNDELKHVVIAIDSDRSFREAGRLRGMLEEFAMLDVVSAVAPVDQ